MTEHTQQGRVSFFCQCSYIPGRVCAPVYILPAGTKCVCASFQGVLISVAVTSWQRRTNSVAVTSWQRRYVSRSLGPLHVST